MRLALDTNILAYAEGLSGSSKKQLAVEMIEKLPPDSTFLPVQVLGELFHVLVRKVKRPPDRVRAAILSWQDSFPLIETSPRVLLAAADLAIDHHLTIRDAIIFIFSAAAAAGCRLLLSEDLP
jgi:predicted nucleic acid-binding protein